jgi:DNA-binding transcriptional regulator GbsR (MarR family)
MDVLLVDIQKKDVDSLFQDKLDQILSTVKKLSDDVNNLENRISKLEENLVQQKDNTLSFEYEKEEENKEVKVLPFNNLDEHLKRTYQILATARKPMTASEIAEQMGRSRSTISYHLNEMEKLEILEKFPGKSKDNSRSMFFKPKQF